MYSTTAEIEQIKMKYTDGYTPEMLWSSLSYWYYEKLMEEGYISTCEEEHTLHYPKETIHRKIAWYSYLLMRIHHNA